MIDRDPHKIPFKNALWIIFLSVVVVSLAFGGGFLYFRHVQEKQRNNPAYQIVAILQTTADSEGLKTIYLAELLGLSMDRPSSLYKFNVKEAQSKLLSSPLIKEAQVKKIPPGTLHVNYTLRKPIAFLGDCTNTAIDAKGVIFPFKPFFTPKKLPEIYLGNDYEEGEQALKLEWGTRLKGKRLELAFTLYDIATNYCCDTLMSLRGIDVSKAFALSYGQRQIVLVFEEYSEKVIDGNLVLYISPYVLRLSTENFRPQLDNYLVLRDYLRKKENSSIVLTKGPIVHPKATIIDLRLSDLAFIGREP